MASYSGTFSAIGDVSPAVHISPGEAFTYSLTESAPGTWIIKLEQGIGGLGAWKEIGSFIDDVATTTLYNTTNERQYYRLRAFAISVVTVDYTLADESSEVVQSFKNPSTGVDEIQFTDQGVSIPRSLSVSGNVTVTGSVSSSGGSQSPSTLIIPGATSPAQTAEGSAVWDTNDDLLTVGTGSTRKTMLDTNSTQNASNKTFTDPVMNGVLNGTGTAAAKKWLIASGAKVGGTAGWTVGGATNIGQMAVCPAGQTGAKLVIPISGLRVGDIITDFNLVGQIESAGNTCTVDADLRRLTTAAGDLVDASIGAMTQLSVTADTAMSAVNTNKTLAAPQTIATDTTFYMVITVTTAASTDVDLQGFTLTITELLFNSGE